MGKGDTRKARTFLAAMAVALVSASGMAQGRSPDPAKASRAFVNEVIQGDLAEIQMGKLAQEKGASEKVKQFGRRLASDHGANLEKARPLAASMGMRLPTTPNAKQKAMYYKLSSLSGPDFDRRFARKMVQDHEKDIRAFQRESSRSGPVANFAKRTLPTLQEHLKIARSLSSSRT
jgi:putative membrane protein